MCIGLHQNAGAQNIWRRHVLFIILSFFLFRIFSKNGKRSFCSTFYGDLHGNLPTASIVHGFAGVTPSILLLDTLDNETEGSTHALFHDEPLSAGHCLSISVPCDLGFRVASNLQSDRDVWVQEKEPFHLDTHLMSSKYCGGQWYKDLA